jgi:hypothetical protein
MSRYQTRKPIRRTGIPAAWTSFRERKELLPCAVTLFEAALKKPVYDGNENVWDPVLELLNLPLGYQPVIAIVLRQERWRTAADPKAYVATAASRQARSMKLLPDLPTMTLGESKRQAYITKTMDRK